MSISQEFLELCQAQLTLLVQGLDLSFGMIYLATDGEYDGEAPTLVPVVAYPETAMSRGVTHLLPGQTSSRTTAAELSVDSDSEAKHRDEPQTDTMSWHGVSAIDVLGDVAQRDEAVVVDGPAALTTGRIRSDANADFAQASDGRVLIPLTYRDIVLGLLVLDRVAQTWTAAEQHQIENVTHSLAAGCMIDRRSRWLNQKLQEQHLAYEAFHQQQDTMLDTLLHQLRNPLTAVQTFGKLLLKRIQPGETNRMAAEGIARESDRIRLLLEQFSQIMAPMPPTLPSADMVDDAAYADIRDAGRFDVMPSDIALPNAADGKRQASRDPDSSVVSSQLLTGGPLNLQPLDLDQVLIPILQTAVAIAQERNIHIHHDQQAASRVVADATALREVLNNLLDNAIKYTPVGGYIEVRSGIDPPSDADDDRLASWQALVIADTGPGIPPEDQRQLFERHFRGVQSDGDIPGTGLGLAIAKDLTQQMKGRLAVFSPAIDSQLLSPDYLDQYADAGPGTAVVIQLPVAESAKG